MFNRYGSNDRRRFARSKTNLTIWYKVNSPLHIRSLAGDHEIEATALDLSERGISFLSKYNIPSWATLLIKFVLSRTYRQGLVSVSAPLQISAEVRSSILLDNNKYRIGVCFKEIAREDKCEIVNFVESTARP